MQLYKGCVSVAFNSYRVLFNFAQKRDDNSWKSFASREAIHHLNYDKRLRHCIYSNFN